MGVREQVSARKSPNKSNGKNLSSREALNSEISRGQAKENIKLKPSPFAVWRITAYSQKGRGPGIYKWYWHGRGTNDRVACVEKLM